MILKGLVPQILRKKRMPAEIPFPEFRHSVSFYDKDSLLITPSAFSLTSEWPFDPFVFRF
jgi:hypothetical protein